MKKAILVVSFGTTIRETRQANIDVLEQEIQAAYPDREIRRAFTSGMVRAKIYEEEGLRIDPPAAALENLRRDGFEDVIVQPTHIIPGDEYDRLTAIQWFGCLLNIVGVMMITLSKKKLAH